MEVPNRKVTVGAVAGAVATIVAWSGRAFGGIDLPGGVEAAFATIVMFTLSYLIPEVPRDSDS